MDLRWGKRVPKDGEYDDEGTWIWVSMATECRLVLSHIVGDRSQKSADRLVKRAAECLQSLPLFVTDGLKFYKIALLKQYGKLQSFERTGKRGRPRLPRLIPDEVLKYAQVIKQREGRVLTSVEKRAIFGENIDPKMISTSYIERQNLTCRQDNNRISRKTIGFSKEEEPLDQQMTLYFANFNFCRKHRSLGYKDENGITRFNSPAKQAGLIDHVWCLQELLTFPFHKIQTY
jgi:IS1 family transposase